MNDDKAVRLTEAALAFEQAREAETALAFLRKIMGGYEYEQNATVKFVEGYMCAMKRIERQASQ